MNPNCFKFVLLIFIISMGVAVSEVTNTNSAIEHNLRVTEVKKTATLNSNSKTRICGKIEIRFIFEVEKLRDCRVVEGSVSLLLLDELTKESFQNVSFPDLLEITGFLMLYRVTSLRSLHDLFPNLAVIRGREIFENFSLIVYELEDLEEIGLINLQSIEKGNVRIEKNRKLCYADKIDWTLIAGSGEHHVVNNQLHAHCPWCNRALDCPKTRNEKRCWNQRHCQVECNCISRSCTKSGKCCDPSCIGGCDEDEPQKCKACKKFMVGDQDNFRCSDSCPDGSFEYLQRRCLTKQECHNLNVHATTEDQNTFIPFNRTCMIGCPSGFNEIRRKDGLLTCRICEPVCLKRCRAKVIDSIAAAQSLKGCGIIDGPLEIQIRKYSSNLVKELESSLSDIVEITDYLKVARTFPIVSLSFLKNLRIIRGNRLESNKYSVIIWDNQNLEELWGEEQQVRIDKGKLFFHFNPKLCFYKIEKLAMSHARIELYDTAARSNGDKISCNVTTFPVRVAKVYDQSAVLLWSPLQFEDERSLLSYEVYYIPAPYRNVTLWTGRDVNGNDGWLVDEVNDFTSTEEVASIITKLEPFTQYAYYVKAHVLSSEKYAQSNIDYFRTLPSEPQAVKKLRATGKSSSSVEIRWEPPKKMNGKFSHYVLRAKILKRNELSLVRNYCLQPMEPADVEHKIASFEKVNKKLDGACNWQSCKAFCKAGTATEGEDEQRQPPIDFEDAIQDYIYVISDSHDFRAKRQTRDDAFSEHDNQHTTSKRKSEIISKTNDDTELEYFFLEITNSSQTLFELQNLKPYSNYQIFLRACREKTDPDTMEDNCGPEAQITTKTMAKTENDDITVFDAYEVDAKQKSIGRAIFVSWQPPANPNGSILSFHIRYRKNEANQKRPWESLCIVSNNWESFSNNLTISYLSSGNFSVQVAATSMAGKENFKLTKYVTVD